MKEYTKIGETFIHNNSYLIMQEKFDSLIADGIKSFSYLNFHCIQVSRLNLDDLTFKYCNFSENCYFHSCIYKGKFLTDDCCKKLLIGMNNYIVRITSAYPSQVHQTILDY
jgi:hypothetical protein